MTIIDNDMVDIINAVHGVKQLCCAQEQMDNEENGKPTHMYNVIDLKSVKADGSIDYFGGLKEINDTHGQNGHYQYNQNTHEPCPCAYILIHIKVSVGDYWCICCLFN